MHRWLLAIMLAAFALTATAQDYEREARWRAEVVPNIVVGEPVDIAHGGRSFLGLYTAAAGAKTAVVIVHGIGVHPDHGVIGTLRMALADRGYSTLSIQMPVLAADAAQEAYPPLFPDAAQRIARAAEWLRAKGYRDLVLVSHSLGARMANAYFDSQPNAFRAWAALGFGVDFSRTFVQRRPVPVLDVYGERDLPAVLAARLPRAQTIGGIPGSHQVRIAGADHFYAGQEKALVDTLVDFIGTPK